MVMVAPFHAACLAVDVLLKHRGPGSHGITRAPFPEGERGAPFCSPRPGVQAARVQPVHRLPAAPLCPDRVDGAFATVQLGERPAPVPRFSCHLLSTSGRPSLCWAAAGCALSPGECPHSGPPTLICSLHPRGPDPAGPSGLSRPRRLQYPLLDPEGRGCTAVGEGLRGRSFEPPIVWAFFWAAPRDHQVRVMGKVGCSPGGRQVTRSSLGPPGARPSPPRAPGSSEGPVLSSRAPPEGIQRLWLWLEPLPDGLPRECARLPRSAAHANRRLGGGAGCIGKRGTVLRVPHNHPFTEKKTFRRSCTRTASSRC